MKKSVLFLIAVIFFVSVVYAVEYNASCNVNSDCKLDVPSKLSECLQCDSYGCLFFDLNSSEVVAVNKSWTPNCTEREPPDACATCVGGLVGSGYESRC